MGGEIDASSRPGHGSCFALELGFLVPEGGRDSGQAGAGGPTPADTPLRGLQVLLADDNVTNQQVVRQILRRAGAGVTLAGTGQEALDRLREQPFDAVLMDLQMPGMGGLEAAVEIRKDPRWAELPVIALTAEEVPGVREKVLAAGMTGYLAKPFAAAGLIGALGRLISVAGTEAPEPAETVRPEWGGRIPGVDARSALARLGMGPEKYLHYLRRFGTGQSAALIELRAALELGDLATARRHAHTMKGAALTMGADALAAALRELEALLERGAGGGWGPLLAQAEQRLEAITAGLAQLPVPEPAPAGPTDWPAVQEALEALRSALAEDDARAGRELARLEALVQGSPLQAALLPLKGQVETYDFRRALELFPAFLAQVEGLR